MNKVLIVSKTKMYGGKACIGGIAFPEMRCVRLLNSNGTYQSALSEFEIGQFWEIDFTPVQNTTPPHTEDVLIISKRKLTETFTDFSSLINKQELVNRVWRGAASGLFNSLVGWTGNGSGYIAESIGVPNLSTGFWIPDKPLKFSNNYYRYSGSATVFGKSYDIENNIKYVGFVQPISIIPVDTIVRVSLAKWWKPDNIEMEFRCYLQLSGWY